MKQTEQSWKIYVAGMLFVVFSVLAFKLKKTGLLTFQHIKTKLDIISKFDQTDFFLNL